MKLADILPEILQEIEYQESAYVKEPWQFLNWLYNTMAHSGQGVKSIRRTNDDAILVTFDRKKFWRITVE